MVDSRPPRKLFIIIIHVPGTSMQVAVIYSQCDIQPWARAVSSFPPSAFGLSNNNTRTMFMHVVIMTKNITRVLPVHLVSADSAPDGRQPSDQANRLGL